MSVPAPLSRRVASSVQMLVTDVTFPSSGSVVVVLVVFDVDFHDFDGSRAVPAKVSHVGFEGQLARVDHLIATELDPVRG